VFWILPNSGHGVCWLLRELPLRNTIKSLITAPSSTWKRKVSILIAVKLVSDPTITGNCKDYAKYLQAHACAMSLEFIWRVRSRKCKLDPLFLTSRIISNISNWFILIFNDFSLLFAVNWKHLRIPTCTSLFRFMQFFQHYNSENNHFTAITAMQYLAIPKPGNCDVANRRNKWSFISGREAVIF